MSSTLCHQWQFALSHVSLKQDVVIFFFCFISILSRGVKQAIVQATAIPNASSLESSTAAVGGSFVSFNIPTALSKSNSLFPWSYLSVSDSQGFIFIIFSCLYKTVGNSKGKNAQNCINNSGR